MKPTEAELRAALARCRPDLGKRPIEFLGEGWDFWVFAAGDVSLRCPRGDYPWAEKLDMELKLLPELAPRLPLPVPVPIGMCPEGPGGLPMALFSRVPGVPLMDLKRRPAPGFGAALGRFIRALQTFPVARAVELGLRVVDGAAAKTNREADYSRYQQTVIPLLNPKASRLVSEVVDRHLNNYREYQFDLCLAHLDIDDRNTLADPMTGDLTGVIDFGDAGVCSPIADFSWPYSVGFAQLGISEQIPDLLREGGIPEEQIAWRRDWDPVWFALNDIQHGLHTKQERFVVNGIQALDELVTRHAEGR